jgi:hypothetical protein
MRKLIYVLTTALMSTLKDKGRANDCSWEGNFDGTEKHPLGYNSTQYITLLTWLMWRAFTL